MAASTAESHQASVDDCVVDFINNLFGDNVKNLAGIKPIYEKKKNEKADLEKRLSTAGVKISSEITKGINNAEAAARQIRKLQKKRDVLVEDIQKQTRDSSAMREKLLELHMKIRALEQHANYLTLAAKVEDFSSQIQAALLTDSMTSAVAVFKSLAEVHDFLQESDCGNLQSFVCETVLFWNRLLCDKIAAEFEEVLKAMRWPLVTTTIKQPTPTNVAETKGKMESLFLQLLQLHTPAAVQIQQQVSAALLQKVPDLQPLLLPLHLMVMPIRKRFRFHFYSQKQTNCLGKPEWYFAQVLNWIRDHSQFLETNIQPILDRAGMSSVSAKVEVMRGLVMLAMEKMVNDIPELLYDEVMFSHLVDEVLLFDRDLRLSYGYPASLPGCLHVLITEEAFNKWLTVEHKFAMEKVDRMLESPTAWQSQYKDVFQIEDLKVPECAESFMTLLLTITGSQTASCLCRWENIHFEHLSVGEKLQIMNTCLLRTITERYKPLPKREHQLRFLGLQLELLEDWRIRVVQLMKAETHSPLVGPRFGPILNSLHYVCEILQEWSELSFFLELQYLRKHWSKTNKTPVEEAALAAASLESTVFDDIIKLLESIKTDMVRNLATYVFTDVQARSRPYRRDKWTAVVPEKEVKAGLGLSPSACEMMMVLKDHLVTLREMLSHPLFALCWQKLASKIDSFILKQVILDNHFSDSGAMQLNFDMTRNLFTLFGEFTQRPENYFRCTKEACLLLTLKSGTAIMLKELIESHLSSTKSTDPNEPQTNISDHLHDVGIFTLTSSQVVSVLKTRADLNPL